MEWSDYIRPELLVLIPVLYLIGAFLKKSRVEDSSIPGILGGAGIVLAALYLAAAGSVWDRRSVLEAAFAASTQGILCAGAAVYANQMAKQMKKAEACAPCADRDFDTTKK